jgi:hypothetical protein
MYFSTKNYLKSNHNHTAKHTLNLIGITIEMVFFKNQNNSLSYFLANKYFCRKFQSDNYIGLDHGSIDLASELQEAKCTSFL